MKVKYLSRFSKDLDKIKSQKTKITIRQIVNEVKSAESINEIKNLKKLSGHKHAYRIRLGQYRIGIYIEKDVVEFARLVHRKDIYKLFP